ncbi:putative lipid II flippase FtsW [Desulfonatronovibrio hydrogenovorans]|uniref:putative lipid II flippase FtsW n=1 Tax=Desulfonatronovibrio hydrogenovorans TaxID=53245 RepID=UPI000558684A|nr:putative lipid II flippase FtsW [Desulfonatronovibrio hydrogenovorans]
MNAQRKTIQSAGPDIWLFFAVMVLCGLGLTMILSTSAIMAERFYSDKYFFFRKQLIFVCTGLTVLALVYFTPRNFFYRLKYVWVILALLAFGLTIFSPLGITAGGATRWLDLGFINVQPLEMAKISLVIYLACFFAGKQEMVKSFSVGFLPPTIITGIFCVFLLLQPDFGGAVYMAALLFLMSLIGGTRIIYLFSSSVLALITAAILVMQSPYRFRRWFSFLDPFKDAQDSGYQLVQSLYAFGSGGIWGMGLGEGRQKLFFLPEAHNDFIMAVVGEELGFIGVSLVFVLLGIIIWRVVAISISQNELVDRFAGFGMGMILIIGSLLNLAVVLGMVPPKGLPMPFISYGGSSLLVSMFCAGFLLNLSRGR